MPPGYIMRRWVTSSVLRYEDGGVDKYKPASSGLPIEAFGNDGLLAVGNAFSQQAAGKRPKEIKCKASVPALLYGSFSQGAWTEGSNLQIVETAGVFTQ
jgi:hypothetical protein